MPTAQNNKLISKYINTVEQNGLNKYNLEQLFKDDFKTIPKKEVLGLYFLVTQIQEVSPENLKLSELMKYYTEKGNDEKYLNDLNTQTIKMHKMSAQIFQNTFSLNHLEEEEVDKIGFSLYFSAIQIAPKLV